jgi:hypothetical protein
MIQAMGRGELTSGGRTCSCLGGGVADAGDLVVAGDGRSEGMTLAAVAPPLVRSAPPLDGSGYGAKRESSTRLL